MALKESIGKDTIDIVIMSLLSEEDMYGYQITQSVTTLTDGLLSLNTGAMYTALYEMEEKGYISSSQVKVKTRQIRIYYHLTEKGRCRLKERREEYRKIQLTLNQLLKIEY